MSTQEILLEEIKRQPDAVLREVWHYLKFLSRQREEEAWADVLPTRDVEQEVLDILDGDDVVFTSAKSSPSLCPSPTHRSAYPNSELSS